MKSFVSCASLSIARVSRFSFSVRCNYIFICPASPILMSQTKTEDWASFCFTQLNAMRAVGGGRCTCKAGVDSKGEHTVVFVFTVDTQQTELRIRCNQVEKHEEGNNTLNEKDSH